ncbi:MAG: hypothetical protein WCJ56_07560 [bacterium]
MKNLLLLLLILTSLPAFALDWKTLKTDHFTVFYPPGYEGQAFELLETMEYYRPRVETLTGGSAENFPITIEDVGVSANGFMNPWEPTIHVYRGMPAAPQSMENWWADVGVHEYTHALQLTNTSGTPALWKKYLGNGLQPNIQSPLWLIEGMAVYSESQLSPHQGRLNDGVFDAYIGACARENKLPSINEATNYPDDHFPRDHDYIFGSAFMRYLAVTYGQDKFARFFTANGASVSSLSSLFLPNEGIDNSAREVYGQSLPELWEGWRVYEKARHANFAMDGTRVTQYGEYVGGPVVGAGTLYFTRQYSEKSRPFQPRTSHEIIARDINNGAERSISSTTSSYSLPLKLHGDMLYYGVYEWEAGHANVTDLGYGLASTLHQLNLRSGEDVALYTGGVRAYDELPGGDLLLSIADATDFGSTLYWLKPGGEPVRLCHSDYLIDDLAINDTHIVAAARQHWHALSLYELTLPGEFTPLVDTPWLEAAPLLVGDRLYFSANYGKVYSVYCYDFASKAVLRGTQNGYAFAPAVDAASGDIYYQGVTAEGYDIFVTTAQLARYELPTDAPTVPPKFTLDRTTVRRGDYRDNLKTMWPHGYAPFVQVDNTQQLLGVQLYGGGIQGSADAVGEFPSLNMALGYDFKRSLPLVAMDVSTLHYAPMQISFAYSKYDTRYAGLLVSQPLHLSTAPGLGSVWASALLQTDNDLRRKILIPRLTARWQYPQTDYTFSLAAPLEREQFGSTADRNGLRAEVVVRQYIPHNGELLLDISRRIDPDQYAPALPVIRGYSAGIPVGVGTTSTLEYSRRLGSLQWANWSPSIATHDIIGTLFYDGAYPDHGRSQYSYGAELHLEATTASGYMKLSPGLRLLQTREGAVKAEVFVGVGF